MARKTKAEAEETRQQILDAAEQVFLRQGVSRTSLQEVASAAGVTRGAIYWHFADKAALFHAMMDRVILPCEAALADVMAGPPEAVLDALALLAMSPLRDLATDAQMRRVFTIAMHLTEYTGDMASEQERHRQSVSHYLDQLEALLARAQRAGALASMPPARVSALGLFAIVDGLMYHWTLSPESFDLVAVGEQTIGHFLRGLRAATPGAPAPTPPQNPSAPAPSI
ncbi:TetR family transcriptional regulator [Vitreoscilla filiformis]|jgi:TetR/AcrR family transcriptional regulator, acrAB operon repressor|uniref:TetR family transcriptional regulator n=1 Tax=Vitreoscilla filiformis TaxID=63 RepID=A0A221KB76_VITFI|nr:TetR family transcriptional regulator [Vitreoscilla filiformis]ASM76281.1 TetR family transcriptional regulator [Vitreoscilla filiformis]